MPDKPTNLRDRVTAMESSAKPHPEPRKKAKPTADTSASDDLRKPLRSQRVARDQLACRLPVDLLDRFDAVCARDRIRKQDAVEAALRAWIDSLER